MKVNNSLARRMLEPVTAAFGSAFINVYSGPVPADADAPNTGTLLGTFFQGGNNTIALGAPAKNVVGMKPNEVWNCPNVQNAGTATFFRMGQWGSDNVVDAQTTDTSFPRLQGTVGKSGADMILADPVFVVGTPKKIEFFSLTLPLGL